MGNVGSGKTISIIKEMVDNIEDETSPHYFSNIVTTNKGEHAIPKNIMITRDMIIKEEVVKVKQNGDEVKSLKFNVEQWLQFKKKYNEFNVVIDEAHTLMDSRNFMSKQNRVLNDFLSLIRKICNNPVSECNLTLISQIDSRLDINARKLCTEVRYHINVYDKRCLKCGAVWVEHSELSDFQKHKKCPRCKGKPLKFNSRLIVHYFDNIENYEKWKYNQVKTILQTKKISNIDRYYKFYDTFQLDNLISED